jgi:pimeloyl-ACP methyl ester carboxylesterase
LLDKIMTDRLHCVEAGSLTDPTIVLLHGFGGNINVWDDIIPSLKAKAHVIGFDLPGHGGSVNYPNFGSPRVAAQAVGQDMRLRGIRRFHVVGHSMGGAVASLMALGDPQTIASLTLLAPGGFGADINADLMKRLAEAPTLEALTICYRQMSTPGAALSQTSLSRQAAMRQQPSQLGALALILAKIMRDGQQGQLPLETLAALQVPVSLIWGGQDSVVPVAQFASAPEAFAKTLVPDAGHMLISEAQDVVIDLILAQLG